MFSWLDGAVAKVTGVVASTPAATDATTAVAPPTDERAAPAASSSGSTPTPAPQSGVLTSLFGSVATAVQQTVTHLQERVDAAALQFDAATNAGPAPPPPWSLRGRTVGALDEHTLAREAVLKAQVLNLSQEKWTFLQAPATECLEGFDFTMDAFAPLAQECLRLDPQVSVHRHALRARH